MVRCEVFLPQGGKSIPQYGVYFVLEDKYNPETSLVLMEWAGKIGVDLKDVPRFIFLPFRYDLDKELETEIREQLHALADCYQKAVPAKAMWIRRILRATERLVAQGLTGKPFEEEVEEESDDVTPQRVVPRAANQPHTFEQEAGEAREAGEGVAVVQPLRLNKRGQ